MRDTNWRKRDRRSVRADFGSPQSLAFELRFGGYNPAIDDEFGGAHTPYKDIFGDKFTFQLGLEVDWQALRIPWVGTLGPGAGWGYMSTAAPAKDIDTGKNAKVNTWLTIMPMHVSAVLRADELLRRTGFPVAPYGKFGFGLAHWGTGITGKTSEISGGDKTVYGRGLSYGLHWAVGGMLALDWISPRSMAALDQETGVNHVYVFGEWANYNLGIFGGNQMRVGTSTWVVGMALEM
jgi:hypothetical protein